MQALSLKTPLHKLGACSGRDSAPLALPAPSAEGKAPQVVLICGPHQDLAASMQLLSEAAQLVQHSGRSYAFLLVGRPQVHLPPATPLFIEQCVP